jgi:hypothetical protein
MTGDEQLVEHVVTAWTAWAKAPGNDTKVNDLQAALRALAGCHTTALRRHVTAELREMGSGIVGRDIRAAVTGWLNQEAAA